MVLTFITMIQCRFEKYYLHSHIDITLSIQDVFSTVK